MRRPGGGHARARDGFRHAALIYDSDEEFLAVTVPFLRDGIDAGEAALLAVNARQEALIVDALGERSGLTVLAGSAQYAAPYSTISANGKMFGAHLAAGMPRIRMVGEVPHSGAGAHWNSWVRYEAAINHFWADLPLWGICPYHRRETDDDVLADVERTHAYRITPEAGHIRNARFVEPAAFLSDRARTEIDAMEAAPWHLELTDPSPAFARRSVLELAGTTGLDDEAVQRLGVAVREVVTNAVVHGRRPRWLRVWLADDRVAVAVHDEGAGPADPYVGMVAGTTERPDALGLHLVYQACDEVILEQAEDGFTVHLVARNSRAASPNTSQPRHAQPD